MAIVLVQTPTPTHGGGTRAFVSNVTTGSLLICVIGSWASAPTAITDGPGNTWAEAWVSPTFGLSSERVQCWYAMNAVAGATTLTFTGSGTDRAIVIAEFSGIATSSAIDIAGSNATGNSNAPAAPATGTLSQADELIIGGVTHIGVNQTITEGGGMTLLGELELGSSAADVAASYKITAATTTVTPSWTTGASQNWGAARVTFKGAAAGAAFVADEALIYPDAAVQRAANW